jgi:hypothetical protein
MASRTTPTSGLHQTRLPKTNNGEKISLICVRPEWVLCELSGCAITNSELSIMLKKIISTHAPASVILIRLLVGAVFLTEGIQKFLYPADLGAGRFAKIGGCRRRRFSDYWSGVWRLPVVRW